MEEIDYSMLFRWFIGLSMDEPIWSPTTFSKNRDRLLKADVASAFFDAVSHQARDGRPDVRRALHGGRDDARGVGESEELSAEGRAAPRRRPMIRGTRRSIFMGRPGRTTRMRRRPTPTRSCIARARARKRSWRISATCCSTIAMGWSRTSVPRPRRAPAEREAALRVADAEAPRARPSAGDKNFDVASFVAAVRAAGDHAACGAEGRTAAIDARTTRHPGYAVSQRKRKLIEQVFGWMKTVGGLRKLRHRGGELVDWIVTFTAAAYNLVRLRTLLARPA